uniref:Uncharacterized protein n=1 Tax=Neisseria meningitidis alpha275 TaxID=295996 RepID=C6SLA6_NEIME|nr:hypothetical protein predicted by Glimmer/Critica [Neisseria meningitidis alpha275]
MGLRLVLTMPSEAVSDGIANRLFGGVFDFSAEMGNAASDGIAAFFDGFFGFVPAFFDGVACLFGGAFGGGLCFVKVAGGVLFRALPSAGAGGQGEGGQGGNEKFVHG